jgi:hypothetical protein
MTELLLEGALRDLSRIENEAGRVGGALSVLGCLVDMAADEAREQLAILRESQASTVSPRFSELDSATGLRKFTNDRPEARPVKP